MLLGQQVDRCHSIEQFETAQCFAYVRPNNQNAVIQKKEALRLRILSHCLCACIRLTVNEMKRKNERCTTTYTVGDHSDITQISMNSRERTEIGKLVGQCTCEKTWRVGVDNRLHLFPFLVSSVRERRVSSTCQSASSIHSSV